MTPCVLGAVLVLLLTALTGCAARRPPAATAEEMPGDPPVLFTAARVLLVPLRPRGELEAGLRDALDRELLFAMRERAPGVEWVGAAELRRVVARSPGAAGSPDRLPPLGTRDRERRLTEPLAGELRRFAALVGTRLVVVPHDVAVTETADSAAQLELQLAIVDVRSDRVVWLGALRETVALPLQRPALASFAARAAARLIRAPDAVGGV